MGMRKYAPALKIQDMSGKTRTFTWDSKLGYYAFKTDDQALIHSIMETQRFQTMMQFSVILPDATESPTAPAPEPFELDVESMERADLTALCDQLDLNLPKNASMNMLQAAAKAYAAGRSNKQLELV